MKISTKITFVSLGLITASALAFVTVVAIQRGMLASEMKSLVGEQARNAAGKIVQTLYYNCVSSEQRNQSRFTHDLAIAEEVLAHTEQTVMDSNTVAWSAVNQFTKEKNVVNLPRWVVGGNWIGQNTAVDLLWMPSGI